MAETTILSQYTPRVIDVTASNDGSLTKANIEAMTPQKIVDLSDVALAESEMYRQMTVSRLSGVKQSPIFDLLLSRMKDVTPEFREDGPKGQTYLRPYILRKVEDIVNGNNFEIVAGEADPDAGNVVNGVQHPTHSWKITVKSKSLGKAEDAKLAYTDSGIKNIGRYFLRGQTVVVLNLSGGAVNEPMFKIIDKTSRVAGDGSEVADVIIEPNRTSAWWADGDNAALLPNWKPTNGVVMIGTNSVSDYESWAENEPVDHSERAVAHWMQTCRFTRCYDDLYEDHLNRIMNGEINAYLAAFKELPMAEQNRRMYDIYQKKMLATLLYGQPINEKQTVEGYKDLPQVLDPRNNNGLIEYKAHMLGIFTQYGAADRRIDYEGGDFDINVFEEQVYALKRHREAAKTGSVDSIDFICDKNTANRFKWVMADYYKKRYNISWSRDFAPNQKIEFGQQTMWNYNTYELEEAQCEINIITEPSLTDHKMKFTGGLASRGNMMAAIDWEDIELGMGNSARRVSKTPDLETDPDFKHVIKAIIGHCEMESNQLTAIVGDPNRHLMIENFSNNVPSYSYQAASATEV